MLIGQDFLLLELQKTGSSHIRKLLLETPSLSVKVKGMHNTFESWQSKNPEVKPAIIAASVRNPWDWYVSLWAYGCQGRGGLYQHLASTAPRDVLRKPWFPPQKRLKWRKVYAPAALSEQFRKWLKYLLKSYPQEIPEGYGTWPLRGKVGFMTYRLQQMYSADFSLYRNQWPDREALATFAERALQPNYWIRNENLNHDTAQLARRLRAREDHIEVIWQLNAQRTNASERKDYRSYYDSACQQMVADRESWLIEKFNYDF